MNKSAFCFSLCLLINICLSAHVSTAATLLSTLPNADVPGSAAINGWNIGPTRQSLGVPFLTGSSSATIESITLAIFNGELYSRFGPDLQYHASIYTSWYDGSVGYDKPFVPIGTFAPVYVPYNYFPSALEDVAYSANALSPILLEADQQYWLVVTDDDLVVPGYDPDNKNGFQSWVTSYGYTTLDSLWTRDPNTRPVYQYHDSPLHSNDWSQAWNMRGNAFALYGAPVPEPMTSALFVSSAILLIMIRMRGNATHKQDSGKET